MTDWRIRPARKQDALALAECIDAAYSDYQRSIEGLPAVSDGIAEEIENHRVWVAEQDQLIVGGLVLMMNDGFAVLANVAVDPARSGAGIGRGLIAHAEAECLRSDIPELHLTTHVAMPRNLKFYERLGWVETGRSGNKVRMAKQL